MKISRGCLSLISLVMVLSISSCMDDLPDGDWSPNPSPTPDFNFPFIPQGFPNISIDSVVHDGDSAEVYARLSIPEQANATVYLHDMSLNYWDELVSPPDVLNKTELIKDSVQLDQNGMSFLTSRLKGLTMNTSYQICAESVRYVVIADTLGTGGSCTSFSTVE